MLLPRGLCETPALLRDILTEDTWKKLEQADRDTLETLLPKEDPAERKETLRRLFNWESFRFESPLRLFQHRLKTGLFKPELQRGRALLKKAEARRGRHQVIVYVVSFDMCLIISIIARFVYFFSGNWNGTE